MQSLIFLVTSSFLIVIGYSALDLDASSFDVSSFDASSFDRSSFDEKSLNFLDDSSISLNLLDDSSIQGTNSLDQSTGSDFDLFLDTDDQRSQASASDSGFFLSNDISCDVNNADDAQLFDKRRRDSVCKNPDASIGNVKNSINSIDPFNLDEFLQKQPSALVFETSFEACPVKDYEDSNTPVCDKLATVLQAAQLDVDSADLFNVDPGAFAREFKFES